MKQSLQLKTSQRITLTPQLRKSLELLQLSSIELEQLVATELIENPLLEVAERAESEIETNVAEVQETTDETELADETSWSSGFDLRSQQLSSGNENPLEQTVAKHESLHDHLRWQVGLSILSERDQHIAQTLLHCIDEEGYLSLPIDEVAALLPPQLQVQSDEVNAVLSLIKTFEPRGAGARDLRERLLILLAGLPAETPGLLAAQQIVSEHLGMLAKRDFTRLGKSLKLDRSALSQAVELITSLNPRLDSRFSDQLKNQISADVLVEKKGDHWVARLNPYNQLKLTINDDYVALLHGDSDQQSSDFVALHMQNAKAFIKGIHSRYDTLLAVAARIVAHQQAFFKAGSDHMRPLTLSVIAHELDLHESTISRAIAGKYLMCNRGVFELKAFFPSGVGGDEDTSATAIRSLIKKLIAAEPSSKPLSDNKIAERLKLEGHIIARRTVAKYRESLHIAPSSQRKELS